ncbi:MAG: hypothetical protein ACRCZF_12775 [Gemmataceae bacterium]
MIDSDGMKPSPDPMPAEFHAWQPMVAEVFQATAPPALSDGFAERTIARIQHELAWRRWQRRGCTLLLVIFVLMGLRQIFRAPQTNIVPTPEPITPVRLNEPLYSAGEALATLTRRTTDEQIGPAARLLTTPVAVRPLAPAPAPAPLPALAWPRPAEQTVAQPAQRALQLFLRDVAGAALPAKGRS